MSANRDTLTTLLEICEADVESARIALARAERERELGRDRESTVERALDSLKLRRTSECERFDRRIEQLGATIAEIQLFEERLAGFSSEAKRLGVELTSARAQTEEAANKTRTRRKELKDRLVDQKLLSERLVEKETTKARLDEEMEWDERDALAVRRHTEEA